MRLVIGGKYQGKKKAAYRLFGCREEDFLNGAVCDFADIFTCRAIFDFQDFIRRFMQEGLLKEDFAEKLAEANPDICIVTDEIGYGIVPMDPQERIWRELTGRICCRLAEMSGTVVRVAAGIPVAIKGTIV